MADTQDSNHVAAPQAEEAITAALLDLTGDLDKAQVLQQKLPAWWIDADPQTRQALQDAHEHSQRPHEQAARLLARVKSLRAFCAERLKVFLATKGHASLDIEHDVLEVPRRTVRVKGFSGPVVDAIRIETHSLLQAAMQNFPLVRAEPGAMPHGTLIRTAHKRVSRLSAETFIAYCRELDLGAAYQQHVREVFNLPSPGQAPEDLDSGYNAAVAGVGKSRCLQMQIDLHIAFAKGDISRPTYTLLLALIKADLPASDMTHLLYHGKPMVWRGLNVGGTCLWGVMVLASAIEDGFPPGPVVLYMPNEPVRPWYEYPSLEDFRQYLTLKLQVQTYRQFFTGYLDESERIGFFQRFDQARTLARLEPVVETGNLSRFFFNVCTGKLLLDACTLAVPTAQADEDASKQRLQRYLDAGLTLLNLAGFVLPVLGQLMLGVGIGQLLGEVFESIDDWSHNEKAEALEHLVKVAQSIAGMAAFAAGAKAFGAVKRLATQPVNFFDGMEAVKRPDNSEWLWRRRLTAYRQPPEVVASAVGNASGMYQVNGQSYVKVEGRLYAVAFDTTARRWSVMHPLRGEAYRPPLQHNRAGGWQFVWERHQDWEEKSYILTRLNPSLAALHAEQLKDISTIADLSVPQLQYLAQESLLLPGRFHDGVVRFKQEQKVRDLTWQLEHQEQLDSSTARTQMLALPHMPGWPTGRFFEVLDSEGTLLERYPDPAPFDYEDLSIHITEQQLEGSQVMPTLLGALGAEEKKALLGGVVEPGEAQAMLSRRLLASLKRSHRLVYEQLYQEADGVTHRDHGLLKAHYPSLPSGIAGELLSGASTVQRWQLRKTGRVPLLLAQRTREALQVVEEDQALSGLFWPRQGTEATHRLAVGLLARVPGWPKEMALQVRRAALNGELIAQLGAQGTTRLRTVVTSVEGFQAFDEQGKALGDVAAGGEGFYQALIDTLSADQRVTLRLTGTESAGQLRHELLYKAQAQRNTLFRYLWPERPVPESPVECVQALRGEPVQQLDVLMRKAGKLYPTLSPRQIAVWLENLGLDHLSRAKAVAVLEKQFEALHRTLMQWCDDNAALKKLPYPAEDCRLSRQSVMKAIEHSWKHITLLPDEQGLKVQSLVLDGMVVGPLPILPPEIDFTHVHRLSLNHMALNDDVAYFLKHFKGLDTLELQGNQLTRLPEVLSQISGLQYLRLNDNRLQLTEYTREKLSGLIELKVLNLNNNPLLNPPMINRMFELRALFLRNCMLKELPSGLRMLPYLETVDLRSNTITALPQWLSDVPRGVAQTLNLGANPLAPPSRLLLSDYRKRIGVGMGYLEDDIARLTEQKAQELWFKDVTADFLTKQSIWLALKDEGGSDGLFNLLAELGGTADATQVREDMSRRVWRVLDAAAGDADLRAEVFDRAATPINCDDGAAASFSNLEVLTQLHEVSKGVEGGQLTAKPLLRLGRGLFRLDQLECYAQSYCAENPSADPLEVSLAFRTGLVDRFNLPGQPSHMRFARLGGVTPQDLTSAAHRLHTAELSSALLNYLVELPLWTDYLKKTFSRQFERLNQPFEVRMHGVFDQGQTLSDAVYRERLDEVLREKTRVEKAEISRLTEDALKFDELNLCQVALA